LRADLLVAQGISSAPGPTAREASIPSDVESVPEPEQQSTPTVTGDKVIALPPMAVLSIHSIGHDVLQWHGSQTADASACTTAAGGGLLMDASDEERDG
jgi:hypothetical protein